MNPKPSAIEAFAPIIRGAVWLVCLIWVLVTIGRFAVSTGETENPIQTVAMSVTMGFRVVAAYVLSRAVDGVLLHWYSRDSQ